MGTVSLSYSDEETRTHSLKKSPAKLLPKQKKMSCPLGYTKAKVCPLGYAKAQACPLGYAKASACPLGYSGKVKT